MSSTRKHVNRAEVGAHVCLALEACNLPYGVAHGIEHYPNRLGRDIDIAVPSERIPDAMEVIAGAAEKVSWHIVALQKRVLGHYRIFLRSLSGYEQLEIDLIPNLTWGPFIIFESVSASERSGPFRVDPWISFAKRIFIQVLAGNFDRFNKDYDELVFHSGERQAVFNKLRSLIGLKLLRTFVNAVDNQDVTRLRHLAPTLRWRIGLLRLSFNPFGSLKGFGYWAATKWQNSSLSPCVIPIVHVTGIAQELVDGFLHRLHERAKEVLPITNIQARQLRYQYSFRSALIFGLECLRNYIHDRRASANLVLAVTVSEVSIKSGKPSLVARVFPTSHLAWRCPTREAAIDSNSTVALESSAWQDSQVDNLVKAIDQAFLCLNALDESRPS